jgi:hypothetical protein
MFLNLLFAFLVTICHTPPEPDVTIHVSPVAVFFHLLHGDYLGPCAVLTPTPVPPTATAVPLTATLVPSTATDTPVPPTETLVPTDEPTATLVPTDEIRPTATLEPEVRWRLVVPMMYLLAGPDGQWGYVVSETHPSIERQQALLGWVAVNAPCAGGVYDDGSNRGYWSCDRLADGRFDLYPYLNIVYSRHQER